MNGVTTYFHWDAFGNLVQENDTQNNSIAYYYDPSGNPVGFIRNGDANQKYIYHTNLRGDIVSITDGTDTIQAQYSYNPWGTQTSYSGTMTQPLRYAGYYLDEETGLYYLKSRYYSPEIGRFITKDGYGYVRYEDPKTLNMYVYCGNNPINNSDPSGTLSLDIGSIIDRCKEIISKFLSESDSDSNEPLGEMAWEWFNTQDPGVQLVVAIPAVAALAAAEVGVGCFYVFVVINGELAGIATVSAGDVLVFRATEKFKNYPYIGGQIANQISARWESIKQYPNKPYSPASLPTGIKQLYDNMFK